MFDDKVLAQMEAEEKLRDALIQEEARQEAEKKAAMEAAAPQVAKAVVAAPPPPPSPVKEANVTIAKEANNRAEPQAPDVAMQFATKGECGGGLCWPVSALF